MLATVAVTTGQVVVQLVNRKFTSTALSPSSTEASATFSSSWSTRTTSGTR